MSTRLKHIAKSILTLLLLLGSATSASLLINSRHIGKESVIMLFLLAVLFTTVLTKSYVFGVVSAFTGVMLFNYLFTDPRYSLSIDSTTDVFLLLFFFATAIVAGSITSRLQKQRNIAHRNEQIAMLLSEVSGGFLHVTGRSNIILRGISYIRENTGCVAAVVLEDGSVYNEEGSSVLPENQNVTEYMINGVTKLLGRIKVYDAPRDTISEHELLLKAVATQTGIALDREYIYNEREKIRIAMEREKLRSTLFRSVAHDLRSPLTALSGSSSVLADSFDTLTIPEQKELAKNISEEMIWLTNLVENILNMTRIDESQLVLYKDYEVVDDVVGEALSHMQKLLSGRCFNVTLPSEVIAIPIDGKLIVQVIINLLENAIRHTECDVSISLTVTAENGCAVFTVADTGSGVDLSVKDTLFQNFVRSEKNVSDGRHGMGMGLAICRAVVEAHGGRIWVDKNIPTGSKFIFTLPIEDKESPNGK